MFLMPNRVTRYVTARTLTSVLMALAVLSTIIVLVNFEEVSRTVGSRAETSALELLGLAVLEAPGVILLVMPFAFLFGVLLAFMGLNRRSELIALRAAGVSAWRFVMPAAATAAVIGVLTAVALNPIASFCTSQFERLKDEMTQVRGAPAAKTIWLRQGDKHSQTIIRAQSNEGPGIHLKGVTMFFNTVEPDGQLVFKQRIEAADAVLTHNTWKLSGVREFNPGGVGVNSSKIEVGSTLSEHTALEHFSTATAIPFWSLPGLIARTEAAGISASVYRMQWQQLLSTPLAYAAMAVLAAAFSLRLLRLGGMARFAGSGLALGFVFFFVNQLFDALGKSDVLPAVVAAWSPPALALLVGITLLCYTEDG